VPRRPITSHVGRVPDLRALLRSPSIRGSLQGDRRAGPTTWTVARGPLSTLRSSHATASTVTTVAGDRLVLRASPLCPVAWAGGGHLGVTYKGNTARRRPRPLHCHREYAPSQTVDLQRVRSAAAGCSTNTDVAPRLFIPSRPAGAAAYRLVDGCSQLGRCPAGQCLLGTGANNGQSGSSCTPDRYTRAVARGLLDRGNFMRSLRTRHEPATQRPKATGDAHLRS